MAPKIIPSWRQSSTPRPMPSTPPSTSFPTSSSSCSKLISLSDWWLIKSETDVDGKRLAVGGYHCSCGEQTMHIFTSAPVVKTVDPYTVETTDGSTVRLQGGINRSRMQQNGFPPEVSQCFFIGFPYNWEYYAKKDFAPIIPNSATFPTSSVINNEGIFSVPVAVEFPVVKLFNDCAFNLESSVDDLLLKNITDDSVNYTDDFSNALSPEDLKSLHSRQKDNSANKDPEFITRKMSSTLEATFESPQAFGQRDTNIESNSHSVDKFISTISLPFARSLLKQWTRRKRCGSKLNLQIRAERVRINPPNDDSDVLASTFNENTDILPPSGRESIENDTETSSANASHVGKDNSDCDLGRAQRCYMLRSRAVKMETNSPNSEINLKSKPLNLSESDNKESQNATCVDNLNQKTGCNSSHDAGASTNLKDKCVGGQILESTMEVECEGTYIADDTNKHANDTGNTMHCIDKMNSIDEDVITQTKDFSKCRSDHLEMPGGAWTENRDDTNGTVKHEKNGGITNNQDENQIEVIQESKVSKLKKARNQEMKSSLTRGKIEKQKATLSTSPELLNPKRSRSGRLLLPPINRWQREIVYDMDGSITNIADVGKSTSVTEGTSKHSRRRK